VRISVVILTYNSEATLSSTIEAAALVSDDIRVVDSFSTDRTCEIAKAHGAELCQHEFVNYSVQRNWAIANLPLRHDWELHLDADERISPQLASELRRLQDRRNSAEVNGYYVARLVRFLGRDIRHGGMFPIWHLRLFRRGLGRCEERDYDQHFLVNGPKRKLRGPIIDDIQMPIREWLSRHNRWSDAEVAELSKGPATGNLVTPRLFGNPIERKRYLKRLYLRAPLMLRAFGLFGYRYVLRLGFLDGAEGAIFFALQAFCFRMVVDAKLFERSLGGCEHNVIARVAAERSERLKA
jgi:glycosyltransferase involved in cell wall biosynthesis